MHLSVRVFCTYKCPKAHVIDIRSPPERIKFSERRKGRPALLLQPTENRFRRIVQFFTNEVSLSVCLYFITSMRSVYVALALIDATAFSVFDWDFCAKRRYGPINIFVMTFCPLTHDSDAGALTELTLDFSILCVIDQIHLKHLHWP